MSAGFGTESDPRLTDLEKLSIKEVGQNLAKLIRDVEAGFQSSIQANRRDQPVALLASGALRPLLQAVEQHDLNGLLATFVACKWLGTEMCPDHLMTPQIAELKQLKKKELIDLASLEPTTSIEQIEALPENQKGILSRLHQRRAIAQSIAEARKDQLYDVSEDLVSRQMHE